MDLSVLLCGHRNDRLAFRPFLEFAIYLRLHRGVTDLDRDGHRFNHRAAGRLHLCRDVDVQATLALWNDDNLLHIEIRMIAVLPLLNLALLEQQRARIIDAVLNRNWTGVLCRPNRYVDRNRQAHKCLAEHFVIHADRCGRFTC